MIGIAQQQHGQIVLQNELGMRSRRVPTDTDHGRALGDKSRHEGGKFHGLGGATARAVLGVKVKDHPAPGKGGKRVFAPRGVGQAEGRGLGPDFGPDWLGHDYSLATADRPPRATSFLWMSPIPASG